ncbi:MAG: Hsp70 family protein [Gloeotrichia echinulata DEX184]|jgi:actin-like ATPase involved in cell morphogenesis|nr:Hsp70 family protein [Gloeotrichia echinulata DEX184]
MGETGKVAIPYLLSLLKDSDTNIQVMAAITLGNMGEVAIPYLLSLLKDSDTNIRGMAAFALGHMGEAGKVAIPYLLPLLKDSDTNIRGMAAIALGIMGETGKVAIPYFLSLLKDSDENARAMAATALGHMGEIGKVGIPYLLPLLKDSDETVRAMAATALGNMGEAGKVAIPHLLPLLKDSDEDLRAITAYTLGNISVACQTPIFSSGTKDIPIHLGIDFGTTFSSAAILLNGEIKRVKEPSRLGYSFPSSIFVDKQGKVFVGQFAENQRFQDPSSYIREFKRELGKTMSSTWGIRKFLPEDLVSEMFKVLKQEAEKMVNQPIDGVIATIPASYTGYRSELMEKAARNAGFKQVQLLPEPVAAAIYYDHPSSGGKPLAEGEVLLVYDLGGGTFDAALLQKQGSSYQMLAQPVGDENLGGSNFDWAMYQDLQAQCSDTLRALLNPRAQDERAMKTRLRVKDWLREFKHQLSSVEQHTDDLPVGDFESYTLTRQRFEEMIHPQLQTTCGLCNQLVASAGLRWEQVGKILLVGGSCRIPYVQRLLYSQFKRPVEWVDELELAVCLGAAIYREVGQNGSNAIL